eukprot:5743249-Pleurochrysis_carterae.AAC.1
MILVRSLKTTTIIEKAYGQHLPLMEVVMPPSLSGCACCSSKRTRKGHLDSSRRRCCALGAPVRGACDMAAPDARPAERRFRSGREAAAAPQSPALPDDLRAMSLLCGWDRLAVDGLTVRKEDEKEGAAETAVAVFA